ncbi:hypothetical protein Cs7R123_66180 [Catellatospora sp. TT07R-123]|uniref:hypothetical protein n=1 Tax=Catellatospora sp. TT07R-123 TaxID=2733863 RepID=UPI001B100425|nr:hypothetical protein [Catellatospora sp. TT07R-123]GHJ49276.1 hypothetical protein Cs7R123_66180 [Catellatospora sp. TT07R-123]
MRHTRIGLRRTLAALAAALLLAAGTGCDPITDDPPAGPGAKPEAEGCSVDQSRTQALLPKDGFEVWEEKHHVTVNPCLEFLDLVSTVLDLVPEAERKQVRRFDAFRSKLTTTVNRLNDLKDVIQCGYQTDRLAVGVYQGTKIKWSVGAVLVIRGDADAFLDVSGCYLGKLIRNYICPGCGGGEERPKPEIRPCFDYARKTSGGQDFTVLWVASSNILCAGLHDAFTDDFDKDLQQAETLGRPTLVIRDAAATTATRKGAIPYGSTVYLQCYTKGETVSSPVSDYGPTTTDQWDRVTFDGVTGFVSHAWISERNDEAPPPIGGGQPSDYPETGYNLPECT